jgi:hypothetical protein
MKTPKTSKSSKSRQDGLGSASQGRSYRQCEIETLQSPESTVAVQTLRKRKNVRFNEDSEWIDISGDEASDYSTGEGVKGICMVEDEYILL